MKIRERNEKFNELIKQLIIPLRFGVLTLISQQKVSIFSDNLNDFMNMLLQREFEGVNLYKASDDEHTLDYFI